MTSVHIIIIWFPHDMAPIKYPSMMLLAKFCSLVGNLSVQILIATSKCTKSDSVNHLSCLMGKPTMWFPNRSDINQAVQSQKQAGSLKFRI